MKSTEQYEKYEQSIRSYEDDAIIVRWKFGRELLTEKRANGGKQLPNGRREQIASAISRSPREVNNRLRVAEKYETEKELRNALRTLGTDDIPWRDVLASLSTPKEPRPKVAAVVASSESRTVEVEDATDGGQPAWLEDLLGVVKRYRNRKMDPLPLDLSLEDQATIKGLAESLGHLGLRVVEQLNLVHARKNDRDQTGLDIGDNPSLVKAA